jgi:hypothetical protein
MPRHERKRRAKVRAHRQQDIGWLLANGDEIIERALRKAALEAVKQHWAAGFPVSEWRDGRIVWIGLDGKEHESPFLVRRRRASTQK